MPLKQFYDFFSVGFVSEDSQHRTSKRRLLIVICVLKSRKESSFVVVDCRLVLFAFCGFRNFNLCPAVLLVKVIVYIIVIAIVVVAALEIFLQTTKTGKAMRCVQQNKKASELMGINVKQNIRITAAISSVICLIIGFMVIPLYTVSLSMASMIGLKGFAAGVVGGFGVLPGCIVGGIVVGLIESASVLVIPSVYKDAVAFLVLIIFLLIKPSGILGKKS